MAEIRSSKEILGNIFGGVAPSTVPPVKNLESLLVRDLMERRFVVLRPQTTLQDALHTFVERNLEAAPVTQDGVLKFVLTNQDIIALFEEKSIELGQHRHRIVDYSKEFRSLGSRRVSDVARKKISVFADTSIFDAMTIMDENNMEVVPVVDSENKVIGILSDRAILNVILKNFV